MRIFLGLVAIAVGFIIVWKTEWLLSFFGRVNWAEKHLGYEGGTRLFYKLIGILVILIGIFAVTNLLGGIVLSIFGPLFRGLAPME